MGRKLLNPIATPSKYKTRPMYTKTVSMNWTLRRMNVCDRFVTLRNRVRLQTADVSNRITRFYMVYGGRTINNRKVPNRPSLNGICVYSVFWYFHGWVEQHKSRPCPRPWHYLTDLCIDCSIGYMVWNVRARVNG